MISSLLGISILLIALVGWLCTVMLRRLEEIQTQAKQQQQTLANLTRSLSDLGDKQINTNARIGQLSADVLQRDVYKNADDRHQLAIKSAKQGKSQYELTQRHGLSLDEAALILSLYSPATSTCSLPAVKNANLVNPSNKVDLV